MSEELERKKQFVEEISNAYLLVKSDLKMIFFDLFILPSLTEGGFWITNEEYFNKINERLLELSITSESNKSKKKDYTKCNSDWLKDRLTEIFNTFEKNPETPYGCTYLPSGKEKKLSLYNWLWKEQYPLWDKENDKWKKTLPPIKTKLERLWEELISKAEEDNSPRIEFLEHDVATAGLEAPLQKIVQGTNIKIKLTVKKLGKLLLLEKSPDEKISLLCPSYFAPNIEVKPPEKKIPCNSDSSRFNSFAVEPPIGKYIVLAIISQDYLDLDWINDRGERKPLSLTPEKLEQIVSSLNKLEKEQYDIFYNTFKVV